MSLTFSTSSAEKTLLLLLVTQCVMNFFFHLIRSELFRGLININSLKNENESLFCFSFLNVFGRFIALVRTEDAFNLTPLIMRNGNADSLC